jgi:hypothetical protein
MGRKLESSSVFFVLRSGFWSSKEGCGRRGQGLSLNMSRAERGSERASERARVLSRTSRVVSEFDEILLAHIFRLKSRLVFTHYCGELPSRMNFVLSYFFSRWVFVPFSQILLFIRN